jgi:hypothetical protein
MFARAIDKSPAQPVSNAEVVAMIVADVSKPPALVMAERRRIEARRRAESLQERIRALSSLIGRPGTDSQVEKDVRALNREHKAARAEADAAHKAQREARPPYTEAVAAALAPIRSGTAQKVLAACADLHEACALLDEIARHRRAAGGDATNMPPLSLLLEIEARAKALLP